MTNTTVFLPTKDSLPAKPIKNRVALAGKTTNATLFITFYIKFHFKLAVCLLHYLPVGRHAAG